jgi:predicted dinucleotide-binding enzyme
LVACHFPQSHVVKAFNAIMVGDLRTHGIPPGTRGRRALPIAGDDPASMRCVSDLIDACGFDPVDTGPLAQGWRFERARPVYCIPLDRTALAQRLAETRRDSMVAEGSWHRK